MLHRLLVPLCVLSLAACGGESDEAEAADESAAVSSTEAALTSELSDEVGTTGTPEDLAAAAETRVKANMQPSSCLTTTTAGATTTYVFNNCTGRYGLVTMTGTVTATYSRPSSDVVRVLIESTGFKANDATLNLKATVDATQQGSVKRAEIASETSGTGPRGNTVSREGDYTVTWDEATECITLDGTTGSTRVTSTTVSGFRKCKAQCPSSGTIVHSGARGREVTLTYDGSANAAWSTSGGRSGTVALRCGP
ncbi:MAG: hypothetical protein DI536_29920 [Archangium gephyra]|uniref:Lipoprotein n=1 Tax=Archangium gephyra TaxID=48 RepID=A0A2W5STH1_9BACT|nr:MAG: hypothetical protein DI536_29920 [Archangium gephyra]